MSDKKLFLTVTDATFSHLLITFWWKWGPCNQWSDCHHRGSFSQSE